MSIITKYLDKKYAPRWLILQIDLIICLFSLITAYLLRFNFDLDADALDSLPVVIGLYIVIRAISFKIFRTYAGIIRYTSTEDAKRIFLAVAAGNAIIFSIYIIYLFVFDDALLPLAVIIIDFITALLLLTSFRLGIKIVYSQFSYKPANLKNVVIYGAGRSGLITKRTIDHDGENNYKVIGFIDDDPDKYGKTLEGVEIVNIDGFKKLLSKGDVDQSIISIQDILPSKKQEFIEFCLQFNVKVKSVPPANKWINGELSLKQIKSIKIEDLLEREPIELDKSAIASEVSGKTIMITGASGSIGSELVRQILYFGPKKVILVDQAETPLNDLQLEVKERFNFSNFVSLVSDVRNHRRMEEIFKNFSPQIVFHVAAYKHVPLMEENPSEAILTNVMGTRNIADLSVAFGVAKFVMISTDKAVNPTNVMGASKRIAEIYTQSLNASNQVGETKFITTRFGNVLGSNGSVIPRFREQIAAGGPVTVTHPDIQRYFMTIPEACQLILEAGAMGNGGEIFIFDMGRSVKIIDLATKMIKLSGLSPDKDIKIKFTGLRPGEKIFEELLNDKEQTLPTHHEKIMIARVREYCFDEVSEDIDILIELAKTDKDLAIVKKMKSIVPEFKSQNSLYEQLDKPLRELNL